MKTFMGVDPGKHGAAALVDKDGNYIKSLPVIDGSYQDVAGAARELLSLGDLRLACIEQMVTIPGKTSMIASRKLGISFGLWAGSLAMVGVPIIEARTMTWRKVLGSGPGTKASKADILAHTKNRWPDCAEVVGKDHNQAEAICMAEYARIVALKGDV